MQIEKRTLKNIFLGVVACIVLYWLLHETANVKVFFASVFDIFAPFALGAGMAFILNVPMRSFERKLKKVQNVKWRRLIALLLTFLILLLVLTLVVLLLVPQLIKSVSDMAPKLKGFLIGIEGKINAFLSANPKLKDWLNLDDASGGLSWSSVGDKALTVIGDALSKVAIGMFTAISSITGALTDAVIAIVFSLYCLFQKETLIRQTKKILYACFNEKFADNVVRVARLTNVTFGNFLSGQCVEVCILGTMFAVVMAIFRMPYVPLISVLIAVTAFIPVVGAWAGFAIGTFLILLSNPLQALIFVVIFIVLQQIENNLIYPKVVGTSIGLSGMWVLVAVGIGGDLMGVAGMFIMIPIAAVIHTLIREKINSKLEQKDIDPAKLNDEEPEDTPNEHKKKLVDDPDEEDSSASAQ